MQWRRLLKDLHQPDMGLPKDNSSYDALWGTPYCPFTCTRVDQYKGNTTFHLGTFEDCLTVPNGFYSPANDNALYPCTSSINLPTELQIFTSSGNGTDSCTSSPRLSMVGRLPGGSALAAQEERSASIFSVHRRMQRKAGERDGFGCSST